MNRSSSSANIKPAYWVPDVSDGLIVSTIPQRTDWSLEYNQKLAQMAERVGSDYALSQIRFTVGHSAEHQHESVSFSQAILYAIIKLKTLAAILPDPWHPAVVVKQLATVDHISNGRIAIDVVNGWFKGKFQALGEPQFEHDERYRRSNKFIRVFKGIWTQSKFTFKGDLYHINDYTLSPRLLQKPHPETFQDDGSRAARDNTANVSDQYSTNGNAPEGIKAQIDDIQTKTRENSRTVHTGVNIFIIVYDTEEEARAVLDDIIKHAYAEAVHAFDGAMKQADKASPGGESNWMKSMFEDLVQHNDDLRINLIGTPQQIVECIVHLKSIGVDPILASFLHFTEKVEYLGRKVLPLVCEPEAQRAATSGATNAGMREVKAATSTA